MFFGSDDCKPVVAKSALAEDLGLVDFFGADSAIAVVPFFNSLGPVSAYLSVGTDNGLVRWSTVLYKLRRDWALRFINLKIL